MGIYMILSLCRHDTHDTPVTSRTPPHLHHQPLFTCYQQSARQKKIHRPVASAARLCFICFSRNNQSTTDQACRTGRFCLLSSMDATSRTWYLAAHCIFTKALYNTLQDLFGKMDPYVTFQLAAGANVRARWRCKTHMGGGKTPSWNDRHSFDVVEGDDRIQAQCYDEDQGNSDDLIGMVSIDLSPVFDSGIRDEWFPLQASLFLTISVCV